MTINAKDPIVVAVAAAQHLLQPENPQMLIDGYWGTFTNTTYLKAPPSVRASVDDVLRALKVPAASQLFINSRLAKSKSPASTSEELIAARKRRGEAALSDIKSMVVSRASEYGIVGRSLANLLATIEVESNFKPVAENHRYTVAGAQATFPAAKKLSAQQIMKLVADGPEAFFEAMYGPKGNRVGGPNPGDGGKYYGKGLIQLTGVANYRAFDKAFPSYKALENPRVLIDDRSAAVDSAVWFWMSQVVPRGAAEDIKKATRIVNGSRMLALNERIALSTRYMAQYA